MGQAIGIESIVREHMIEVKLSAELATPSDRALTALQEQVVAALKAADAMNLYDVAAHLDAAHQIIAERMRLRGLANSIISVTPPDNFA